MPDSQKQWSHLMKLLFSCPSPGAHVPIGKNAPEVLTEKAITHGNILLEAIPIGGLRIIDGQEADDKIVAVLQEDATYGGFREISDCPANVVERLRHYFLTYKEVPGGKRNPVEITHIYGREEALEVIRRSRRDYHTRFGDPETFLNTV